MDQQSYTMKRVKRLRSNPRVHSYTTYTCNWGIYPTYPFPFTATIPRINNYSCYILTSLSEFLCASRQNVLPKLLQDCQWLDNSQKQKDISHYWSNSSGLTAYFWNSLLSWITDHFFSLFLYVSCSPPTPLLTFIPTNVLSLIFVLDLPTWYSSDQVAHLIASMNEMKAWTPTYSFTGVTMYSVTLKQLVL